MLIFLAELIFDKQFAHFSENRFRCIWIFFVLCTVFLLFYFSSWCIIAGSAV